MIRRRARASHCCAPRATDADADAASLGARHAARAAAPLHRFAQVGLQIVAQGDNPKLAACARRIMPVRQQGNLLLCTLLLSNVAINALLSILMAGLTSGLVGFLLSTAIITVFGEIIPQAICARYALEIGARVVPLVRVIVLLLWPITKPMAMGLDRALGEEVSAAVQWQWQSAVTLTEVQFTVVLVWQFGLQVQCRGVAIHDTSLYRRSCV
jgi:Cyclin M transmembrane N-terminal domain